MNYNQKLFSIITVVKNDVKNIEKTIKSILNQKKNSNIEYIIIDGNSSDGTKEIIHKYKNMVDKIISEKDNGIYDAMNKGLIVAKGEYLSFCNSGDILFPNAINIIQKTFEKNNSDVVFGVVKRNYVGKTIIKSNLNIKRIYYNFDFATSHTTGFYIKKKVHDEIGFYDLNFKCSADYDFFYRMINSNRYKISLSPIEKIIGEVASGGFSSKFSFIDHLHEETKIRLKNKQNIILIIFIYINSVLKNLNKIFKI